jgi:hypothetical protein
MMTSLEIGLAIGLVYYIIHILWFIAKCLESINKHLETIVDSIEEND